MATAKPSSTPDEHEGQRRIKVTAYMWIVEELVDEGAPSGLRRDALLSLKMMLLGFEDVDTELV
jgi:hypothetical protein